MGLLGSPHGVQFYTLTKPMLDKTGSPVVAFEIFSFEPSDALNTHQLQGSGRTVPLKTPESVSLASVATFIEVAL